MHPFLVLAGTVARAAKDIRIKNFVFGGICVRKDGAIVTAQNGAVQSTQTTDYRMLPSSHCEGRLLQKSDKGATFFITRIAKINNSFAMARPCGVCFLRIKAAKIHKVYYTIDPYHYGIMKFSPSGLVEERIIDV